MSENEIHTLRLCRICASRRWPDMYERYSPWKINDGNEDRPLYQDDLEEQKPDMIKVKTDDFSNRYEFVDGKKRLVF